MTILIMILIAPITILFSVIQLVQLCVMLVFKVFKDPIVDKYLFNNFVALDQLANALFFGDEDETISSRMGKHLAKHDCPFCNFMCKILNLFQKDHCIKAIESDEGKDQVFKG